MRRFLAAVLGLSLVGAGVTVLTAQQSLMPGVVATERDGVAEVKGLITLAAGEADVPKRFVLRYPADRASWNGSLVVGAHGGSGGNNFDPAGKVIGTDETALDDVIGEYAVSRGFAYASVDRDGAMSAADGLALTNQFADRAAAEIGARLGRAPARRYLVGLSMGGGIARAAAESAARPYAGVLIIAGAGGDAQIRADRQRRLVELWPTVDPTRNPGLAPTDPRVTAFAEAIGTPVAARRLWPFTATSAANAAARPPQGPGEHASGHLHVPAIEVVGTWDDFVLPELLAYERRVMPPARYRLYRVDGVWHMSGDDDGVQSFMYIATRMGLDADVARAMGEGPSYLPAVRSAFDALVRWVESDVPPPPGRVLRPGEPVSPSAQPSVPDEPTRADLIRARQADKASRLAPPTPSRAEAIIKEVEETFTSATLGWHPYFENAYQGSGITGGVGYLTYLGPFNTLDVRGSITLNGSKRVETEFRAPRLLGRRARLSLLGGWREARRVNFFGLGTAETSVDDRTTYSFRQPYASATLDVRPTRGALRLIGGVEYSQWEQRAGGGGSPSVETVFSAAQLPGLGAQVTYLQSHATLAFDWRRPGGGYARQGGWYGVTFRDFADQDGPYSFRQVDYDVVQHVPILRDAWVLSLHGRAETTYASDGEVVPFFMMPALGSGSTLRGYSSWRFRDRNSLLLSAEWRVLVNSFVDTVIFYDAGKVAARRSDLDLRGLKSNVGIGLRLHGPAVTPIRIELARGNEGFILVFGASAAF